MCSNNKPYLQIDVTRKLNSGYKIIPCADGGAILEICGRDVFIVKQGFKTNNLK